MYMYLLTIVLSVSNKIQCLTPLADGCRIKCQVSYQDANVPDSREVRILVTRVQTD